LIKGFDRMNFETSLGKPFLRKEMELKMKAICEGRTTKEIVLQESIAQYRQVFMQTQEKLDVLRAVCEPKVAATVSTFNLEAPTNWFTGLPPVCLCAMKR
jgi:DNA topoisomerase III